MQLPEKILSERDMRMFDAHKAGMNYRQIAKAFDVSTSTAHAGVQRIMRREGKRYREESQDVVWLHVERLESLLQHLWPYTKQQKVTTDEGEEVTLPPSMDAVDRVLKVMAAEAKLYGLDKEVISLQLESAPDGSPELSSGESKGEVTSEEMAKQLAAEMIKAGVITGPAADALKSAFNAADVIDVEVVEEEASEGESEHKLPSLLPESTSEAPEWLDDDDDPIPGEWVPDGE